MAQLHGLCNVFSLGDCDIFGMLRDGRRTALLYGYRRVT